MRDFFFLQKCLWHVLGLKGGLQCILKRWLYIYVVGLDYCLYGVFLVKILILSNLSTQCAAPTHNPEIKSLMLY